MKTYREYLKGHTMEELKDYHKYLGKQRWYRLLLYLMIPAYFGSFLWYYIATQEITHDEAVTILSFMLGAVFGSVFMGLLTDPRLEVAFVVRKKRKEREESIVSEDDW